MHTLSLSDAELELLHQSVNNWINSFSHEEPDLLRAGKALRAKIDHEMTRSDATPMSSATMGSTSSGRLTSGGGDDRFVQ